MNKERKSATSMKKSTPRVGVLFSFTFLLLGLTGCDSLFHSHSYNQKIASSDYLCSEATCTNVATYYYSCECGEKGTETFTYGETLPHSFTNYVSNNDATHLKDGTKTAKCDHCNATDTAVDNNSKIPHVFNSKTIDNKFLCSPADCTHPATYYYSCECGEKGTTTFESGTPLGHSFTNYISDNNATCTEDGTKTAKCDRCNVTDTIIDIGSKIPHVYDQKVATDEYLAHDATTTKKAQYYYSCKCGECGTETFEHGEVAQHTIFNKDFCTLLLNDPSQYSVELAKDCVLYHYEYQANILYSRKMHCFNNFELIDQCNYELEPEAELVNSSQYMLFKKEFTTNDETYTIYFLGLSGTGGPDQWVSNIAVGDIIGGFHDGFREGADFVLNRVSKYLVGDKEHTKLLISGYSRGAAVAGVIASKLMESNTIFDKDNLFGYLFACPQYSIRDVKYNNLFAINNTGDLVSKLPVSKWGFHTETEVIYLPVDQETMTKLDEQLFIEQKIFRPRQEPTGFIGTIDCSEGVVAVEKCAPTKDFAQNKVNRECIAEIGNLLSLDSINFSSVVEIIGRMYLNCLFNGIPLSLDAAITLATYVLNNKDSMYCSHEIVTYYTWVNLL